MLRSGLGHLEPKELPILNQIIRHMLRDGGKSEMDRKEVAHGNLDARFESTISRLIRQACENANQPIRVCHFEVRHNPSGSVEPRGPFPFCEIRLLWRASRVTRRAFSRVELPPRPLCELR